MNISLLIKNLSEPASYFTHTVYRKKTNKKQPQQKPVATFFFVTRTLNMHPFCQKKELENKTKQTN